MTIAKLVDKAFRLHYERKQYAEAERLYKQALKLDPMNPEILRLTGLCMSMQGRPESGVEFLREAQRGAPKNPMILANLAATEGHLGDHVKSRELSDRALELDPSLKSAQFNRGIARLSMGEWPQGWQDYEAGLESGDRQVRMAAGERWRGGPLPSGATLVLWWEQGFGDTIMMARFVAQAKLWAGKGVHVVLEVQPELKSLLAGLPGADTLICTTDEMVPFHYHASLLSLPYLFGLTPQMAAEMWYGNYIKPSQLRIDYWEPEVAKYGGLPVGFCTKGNKAHVNDRHRSIHEFADMTPLVMGCSPAKFHSLNLGESQHEFKTFDDLAAIIHHMEIVVTVDSAVAHLAGAMGKLTCLMLPKYGTDFRWMTGIENSCWYPSLMLYRQQEPMNWLDVTKEVARDIKTYMQGGEQSKPVSILTASR